VSQQHARLLTAERLHMHPDGKVPPAVFKGPSSKLASDCSAKERPAFWPVCQFGAFLLNQLKDELSLTLVGGSL
jgi:hypothetical protein